MTLKERAEARLRRALDEMTEAEDDYARCNAIGMSHQAVPRMRRAFEEFGLAIGIARLADLGVKIQTFPTWALGPDAERIARELLGGSEEA